MIWGWFEVGLVQISTNIDLGKEKLSFKRPAAITELFTKSANVSSRRKKKVF